MDEESEEESSSDSSKDESEVAELHPNFKSSLTQKKKYKGCKKYLHRCDEMILRPVLIYKYEKQLMKRSKEFFHIYQKKADELEKDFTEKDSK